MLDQREPSKRAATPTPTAKTFDVSAAHIATSSSDGSGMVCASIAPLP